MLVTVAICTWNRAALLDRTLAGMRELRIPDAASWEVVVVNNNSTDDTDAVIAKHADALPLRRVFEPKPGHSNARNAAIDAAMGDLIVWTDDDVLVDRNWLMEYASAAAVWPQAAFFGGTVTPWFETPPPSWLTRHWQRFAGLYAVREFGSAVRPFAAGEQPFGANMAFRLEAQRAFRFDPDRGHTGSTARGGDETDVVKRMTAAGHTGVWVGSAKVQHFIPADRLTKEFVWQYARRLARLDLSEANPAAGQRWFGVPRYLVRQYLASCVKARWAWLRGGADWADHFLRSAVLRAQVDWHRAAVR